MTDCSICLAELDWMYENIDEIRPCGHAFHRDCLNEWMERDNTCPNCRGNIEGIIEYGPGHN